MSYLFSLSHKIFVGIAITLAVSSCSFAQQLKLYPDPAQVSAPQNSIPSSLSVLPLPEEPAPNRISLPPRAREDSSPSQDPAGSKPDAPQAKVNAADSDTGQQTKRILGIVPNFKSVSTDAHSPPLSVKEKFWLATQDSFDYSSFIYTGLIAGGNMATKSEPSFGQGASGYGNYFAHSIADGTIENYMVEAVLPTLVREDPRYYTLGRGGFFKRSGYALSRLFITRTDAGNPTPNISEIVGAGAAAGIGNSYYPADTNVWVKTYQRWLGQILQDAAGNLAKEFWPDINRAVFRNKY